MGKKAQAAARAPWFWAAAAIVAIAAGLRLVALGYGLPHTYNADEPHLVNMAVSFGGGSLRPHSFKYPTLWPTMLSGLYGLWFALWSAFGLRKGTLDFAALYGFAPTGFYLIARLVAALTSVAAVLVVARAERAGGRAERWPYGALILACAPVLVDLAHSAKPDSLMLLFAAGAWACALRFQSGGARGWLYAAAALIGAACSTQYTAAPLALLLPLAWLLRDGGRPPALRLAQAVLVSAAAFFAGSPFIALDFGRFVADWKDYADLGRLRPHDAAAMAKTVAYNLWTYGGEGSPAGAAAVLGLGLALRRDARRALLLAVPVAAYAAVLSASSDGGWQRYLLGAFPALALLSSEGLALLGGVDPRRRAAVALLAAAPGLFLSARFTANLALPDTRARAEAWIEANVPEGEAILLDLPHASPRAIPSKEQCLDLAARTAAAGSPRARLWRAMAERHPGGGYRIYRVRRSAGDLYSAPRHVAASQADADFLDVRPGLDPVRAVRASWVVTSSIGADPRRARELTAFFTELASGADLVREFPPEPGRTAGPW
ncbi:MAG: glycosyltransferase family 39 protein, partial [Elusimicrobia bacterium]|nr:glycosyltransferase family 39 protein [Elusimicrobiota bacterium]